MGIIKQIVSVISVGVLMLVSGVVAPIVVSQQEHIVLQQQLPLPGWKGHEVDWKKKDTPYTPKTSTEIESELEAKMPRRAGRYISFKYWWDNFGKDKMDEFMHKERSDYNSLVGRSNEYLAEKNKQTRRANGLQTQLDAKTRETDEKQKQLEAKQTQLTEKTQEANEKQQQILGKDKELVALRKEKTKTGQTIRSRNNQIQTLNERIRIFQGRINELTRQGIDLSKEINQKKRELDSAKTTNNNLKKELRERVNQVKVPVQELSQIKDEKKEEAGGGDQTPAKNRSKLALPIGLGVGLGIPIFAGSGSLGYWLMRNYWQ